MKKILIEQGSEFKIYTNDKNKIESTETLFYPQYQRADAIVKELAENFRVKPQDMAHKSEWEYLNNVIAFCGERGQGKSSAMFQFTQTYFDENAWIVRTIDPTALESAHSIIDIVVSRLFEKFRAGVESANRELEDAEQQAMALFQAVHKDMTVLKSEAKFIEREYDYSGSMMRLSEISDSLEMKASLQKLVNLMLEIEKKEYLVIPMDDLDLNIHSVYKVMEQIRKYLILPRVIIVMALNVEQLRLCLEREYTKELGVLKESHRNVEQEAQKMAEKYMDKVIPFGRRILLPAVRTMSRGGSDGVHMLYLTSNGDTLFNSGELGIEEGLLHDIYERTGLIFVKDENRIHPIVPDTLRELINLLMLLGSMRKIPKNAAEKEQFEEEKRENLSLFESYFLNNWLENNLEYEEQGLVKTIMECDAVSMHKTAFLLLFDYLDARKAWPVRNELRKTKTHWAVDAVLDKYEEVSNFRGKIANGDIQNCLCVLKLSRVLNADKIIFAVNTCFSIRMLQMRYENAARQLRQFVGNNVWGAYRLVNAKGAGSSRVRFKYSIYDYVVFMRNQRKFADQSWNKYLTPYESNGYLTMSGIRKLMEENGRDAWHVAKLVYAIGLTSAAMSKDSDEGQRERLIAGNGKMMQDAEFALDALFTSMIDPEWTESQVNRDEWNIKGSFQEVVQSCWGIDRQVCLDVVTNMETAAAVAASIEENRTIHVEGAGSYQHYSNFIENMEKALKKIGNHVGRQFTLANETKRNALAKMLSGFIDLEDYRKVTIDLSSAGNIAAGPSEIEEASVDRNIEAINTAKIPEAENPEASAVRELPDALPIEAMANNFLVLEDKGMASYKSGTAQQKKRLTIAKRNGSLENFEKKLWDMYRFIIENFSGAKKTNYRDKVNALLDETMMHRADFGKDAMVGPELSKRYNEMLRELMDELYSN